jgi:2-polyprenyl-6-methoxyphenol hydroxylase-like FAD-dependent oxidoreductase
MSSGTNESAGEVSGVPDTAAVLIVGAGPGGLMLACELGLAGISVTVLERNTTRSHTSGGSLLHARCVETLRQRGIADRFFDQNTMRWNRTHFGLITIDLVDELGESEYDLLVPQWHTEEVLEERARELGVDIRLGHEVLGVEQDEAGVTVEVRSAAGVERLRAAYLVGCDGVRSTVARLAGFEFEEFSPAYYGITADVASFEGNRDQFTSGLFPTGQIGVLPLQAGRIRLMTVEFAGRPVDEDAPVTAEEVRASIRRVTGTDPEFDEPTWMERNGHPTQLAREYRDGRIFLLGDSAHAHPPSSGNGMVTTIHDATNLGWKLAATLNGWAPADLLDTYHQERHPVGRRACVRAQAQVGAMHPIDRVGPLREILADLIGFEDVRRYLVQYVTEVRYSFPFPGGAAGAEAHPLLGARLPDVAVTTASGTEKNVLDFLAAGHGVVLDFTGDGSESADLASRADRLTVVHAEPTPLIDARMLLVRPDGHIAWVDSDGTDGEGLSSAVKTWFG